MKAAIIGYGRMGRAVEAVLTEAGHEAVLRFGAEGDGGGRSLAEALAKAKPDVAIEFTVPSVARRNVETLIATGTPTVCGTTGWDAAGIAEFATEKRVAVLIAPNFSIGVAVMRRAVAQAAAVLRAFGEFEVGLVERHHSAKVDAPSGTARMLADDLKRAAYADVPVVSLRQGGQPGEHTVIFDGPYESLSIQHQARSRGVFASGAVRAAEWLVAERPVGLVTFEQVLERTPSC
jgi:4-hydroxy-tetrahydrodipicolinate reductase